MTEMRIVFLGTGGGMPSKSRGLPSIAVKTSGTVILMDCGEGTQRQFMLSGIGFKKEFHIFLTHHHGDHVLGLPGLLFTMAMSGRGDPVWVYGPRGTGDLLERLMHPRLGRIPFRYVVREMRPGDSVKIKNLTVGCTASDHTQEVLAYCVQEDDRPGKMREEYLDLLGVPRGPLWGKLQRGEHIIFKDRMIKPEEAVGPPRKGRRIVYTGDTRPCGNVVEIARQADVLIHDSTFDNLMSDNANLEGHSTAMQAAEIASKANVSLLCLFHISPRYNNPVNLLLEAKSVFPNTIVAEDLMSIKVPYR